MTRTMVFLVALLAMGLGPVDLVGCSDDTATPDDGGADADADEGSADADADSEAEVSCLPSCNAALCEECVAGSCENTCETGERCDGMGTCTTGPMPVGGPCTADADCTGGVCFTEYAQGVAGGYCTASCDETHPCAVGICEPFTDGSYCFRDCSAADCRAGYDCITFSGAEICWANCTDDWQCTSTTYCEIEEGQGWCSCPAGQHINDPPTACVYDDCASLACDTLHRACDATGGCGGLCAACGACDPADYVLSTNHCYPAGATWGGPCTTDADCPGTGTPGVDTSCWAEGHGNCIQIGGPDVGVEGTPCTGDPGSVTITLYDMSGNPYLSCLQACTVATDCEPGLTCDVGGSTGDIQHCWPIADCTTAADCNDPASELYCSSDGACYVDGCNPNPCTTLANSNGVCVNVTSDYRCGCAPGNVWNGETHTCDAYTCPATATAVGSTVTGDTCTGTTQYDPAGDGDSCTGYAEAGQELVYSLEVPAVSMVDITVTATDYDIAVWATTMCEDLTGENCVAGADAGLEGDPETIAIINNGAAAATYYVIVDGYTGCAAFSMVVGTATPAPVCGDGILATVVGETCDDGNLTPGDGCSATCIVEFGWGCVGTAPSVCTGYPRLGPYLAGAAIPPQTGGPVTAGTRVGFLVEFSVSVLLDGTLTATGGDPDVFVSTPTSVVASHRGTGTTETWTDDSLAAGIYAVEVEAYSLSGDVPSFTLNLSTTAP